MVSKNTEKDQYKTFDLESEIKLGNAFGTI